MSKSDPDVSKILDFFNNTEGYDVKPDVTYLNAEKDGYVSYVTGRNAKKVVSTEYPAYATIFDDNPSIGRAEVLWPNTTLSKVKSKNVVRLGRLINQLFPGKFTDKQIEKFVNEYKSSVEMNEEKIKVVEGDDIKFWYNSKNYTVRSGTLGNSCMSSVNSSFFEIYAQNPESCRMVIIIENNKLKARALVWKVQDQEFEYFLDRQYSITDSDINKLRKFAEDQGWAYKTHNNHLSIKAVTYKGKSSDIEMQIKLKQWNNSYDYQMYPYMDTFKIYDPNDGTLFNRNQNEGEIGDYYLVNTDGSPEEILDQKYSDYYDEHIPSSEAIWSEPLSDWIWRNDTVTVSIGNPENRGIYPAGYDNIKYIDEVGEYAHIDDCIYSGTIGRWFLKSECVQIISKIHSHLSISIDYVPKDYTDIIDIKEVKNLNWFKKIEQNNGILTNCVGILKFQLEKDVDGYIPISIKITTYKVTENTNDESSMVKSLPVEYLTKVDSDILGCKVDMDDSRMESVLDYENNLLPIYPILIDIISNRMSDLSKRFDRSDRFERDQIQRDYYIIRNRRLEIEGKKFIYR